MPGGYTIVMSCARREREGGREEGKEEKPSIQLSQTFTPKSTHLYNHIHSFNTLTKREATYCCMLGGRGRERVGARGKGGKIIYSLAKHSHLRAHTTIYSQF